MLEITISQAKLRLADKKKSYGSNQRLLASGAISRGQLDESKTLYELAETELESARSNLQRTMVDLDSQISGLQNDLGTAENNYRTREGEVRGIVLSRKKGEFQYEKDKATIEDQLRKKDFDIRSAQLEIETNASSIKRAISSKTITENQVEDARSELKKAEEDLREGSRIVAPTAGFIEEVLLQEGQEATPGQPVIRMASRELEFVGLIASRYKERVVEGQKVKVEFEEFQKGGGDDIEHQGVVVRVTDEKVASQGGSAGKMYKVKIRIDPPTAEKHRDQMPGIGYSGAGNVLTQEMSLLKYWVFHKVLKKI
jgi:multidrug resistance efflux pump